MDHFIAVAEERLRLADYLDTLDEAGWATPSCCAGWTVAETTAHLLVGPILGMKGALPFIVRAFGRPNKTNDLTARELVKMGPQRLVAELRANAENRFKPPGFSSEAPLVDVTIHGQDITRALGDTLDVPTERWKFALDSAVSGRYAIISAKSNLKGLSFAATDMDFRTGTGPEVTCLARDLAHAMWGRSQALTALEGDGADTLRSRLA